MGCPVRATMEAVRIGETPAGVEVFMDRNAYEADAVVVVNRIKPHTAFRGEVESGPTKMLAIGLGKQKGAHSVHAACSSRPRSAARSRTTPSGSSSRRRPHAPPR